MFASTVSCSYRIAHVHKNDVVKNVTPMKKITANMFPPEATKKHWFSMWPVHLPNCIPNKSTTALPFSRTNLG